MKTHTVCSHTFRVERHFDVIEVPAYELSRCIDFTNAKSHLRGR